MTHEGSWRGFSPHDPAIRSAADIGADDLHKTLVFASTAIESVRRQPSNRLSGETGWYGQARLSLADSALPWLHQRELSEVTAAGTPAKYLSVAPTPALPRHLVPVAGCGEVFVKNTQTPRPASARTLLAVSPLAVEVQRPAPQPRSDRLTATRVFSQPLAKSWAAPAIARPVTPAAAPAVARPVTPVVRERAAANPNGHGLFRQQAIDAHMGPKHLAELATPKLATWGALVVLASLVALLFAGAAIASIEITVKAPGALRSPSGLRSVETILSGSITEVLVRAGDDIKKGQIVARLEDAKLLATLELRKSELATLRRDFLEASAADQKLLDEASHALSQRRGVLNNRSKIKRAQLAQRTERAHNLEALVQMGAASRNDALAVQESVQQARESLTLLSAERANTRLQLADRKRDWEQREVDRRTQISRAEAAVNEAHSLLELVEVRAPAAGRIESLLVRPGAVVQSGKVLAQIVPHNVPRTVVAFLPSRETAFVRVGSLAKLEVESLPVNEFGMALAEVTRISSDIAKPEELMAAFGEANSGSYVRVELSLLPSEEHDAMKPHLRTGERVVVRLHRRQRRVLSLLFEFVRRWSRQ